MTDPDRTISEVTRRAIFDEFSLNGVEWWGRLSEPEFLSRLYNLGSLPSTDARYRDALGDIQQHRVNWNDWDDDWVFHDSRFELLRGSDDRFIAFLAEMVNPVVRAKELDAVAIVEIANRHLRNDGWALVPDMPVSGRSVFSPVRQEARHAAIKGPTGWQKVDRQIQEAHLRLSSAKNEEQFQAVGLICREALISVAQECFDPSRHLLGSQIEPSKTDAGRMIEAVFAADLSGSSNEEARAHGKASLRLALALQHRRSADFRMAALCVEATASVVNLLAILAGRRG